MAQILRKYSQTYYSAKHEKNSDTTILWSGFSKSCIHCFRKQKMKLQIQRRVWECFIKINMTYSRVQNFHPWGLNQKGRQEYAHVNTHTQMPIVCVLGLSHQCDQRAEQGSLGEGPQCLQCQYIMAEKVQGNEHFKSWPPESRRSLQVHYSDICRKGGGQQPPRPHSRKCFSPTVASYLTLPLLLFNISYDTIK